jgi:hypothetical protein
MTEGGIERVPPAARRLMACSPQEQQEFARVSRQLLRTGIGEDELRRALGYETLYRLRLAIENGRITPMRLERLRQLAAGVFGGQPPEDRAGPPEGEPAGRTNPADGRNGRASVRPEGMERDRLSRSQHRRLRDHVEHLWALDKRFRNWSLLARAGGLSSGQAMKRAYEVGSTLHTLQTVELFCRLHAAFGSRATAALADNVAVDGIKERLLDSGNSTPGYLELDENGMNVERDSAASRGSDLRKSAQTGGTGGGVLTAAPRNGRSGTPRVRARGRPKKHLTEAQHRKLRELIEELWQREPRLRNWSLLARAVVLTSGQAAKRAYDVNSSETTLANLEQFAAMHRRFGPVATDALRRGVTLEDLADHLVRADAAPSIGSPAQTAGSIGADHGAPATPAAQPSIAKNRAGPPAVDAAGIIAVGEAIDLEVQRLWQSAIFFEDVASRDSLPRIVRSSARLAGERLHSIIELFSAEGSS